jgi:hypothetical protein
MTAAYRDHANNRSGDRGALMESRAMTEIVLFTEFGGPLTKRPAIGTGDQRPRSGSDRNGVRA